MVVGICAATVLWRINNGFDLTDEASYVVAASPPAPDAAFNGLSGLYLRKLWQLAGWDLAVVRALGLLGVLGAGALLGQATSRLLRRRRGLTIAATTAASTSFYATGLRTPSYNWLAVIGAQLVCAAVLHMLARGPDRWGLLGGAGLVVAGCGKATTGLALALLLVGACSGMRRLRPLVSAGLAVVVGVTVHVAIVLPARETLMLLSRSRTFLAALDPHNYSVSGSALGLLVAVVLSLGAALTGGGVLGVLPLLAARPRPVRTDRLRVLGVVAVVGASGLALVTGHWSGVEDSPERAGGGLLVLAAALALVLLVARAAGPAPAEARVRLMGAPVLLLAALACVFGTNVRADGVLQTMAGLLAPACLLLADAASSELRDALVAATVTCVLAGAAVAAVQAHLAPKRGAALEGSTAPVTLGPTRVRLDPDTASAFEAFVGASRAAGWRPGTPLVDASFTPAIGLALGATVPPVLFPGVPGWPMSSVCTAVRGLDASWSQAWIAVHPGLARGNAAVAKALGRTYPDDYVVVGTFRGRYMPWPVTLLRPRPGVVTGPGCLAGSRSARAQAPSPPLGSSGRFEAGRWSPAS